MGAYTTSEKNKNLLGLNISSQNDCLTDIS